MTGKAYLVGAGPGRPDLITVRGLELLRCADVVIFDRLIAQELLDEARPDAERIFVGKRCGHHVATQAQINALLVDRVRRGKIVVRLKGGDPLIFGQGGEEMEALAATGLPYEVVPGVSSVNAAAAYAAAPLTRRGVASGFAVLTGSEAPDKPGSRLDWQALAHAPTLVILMAMKNIGSICRALQEAGRSDETPALVVSWAGTCRQQTLRSTLAELPTALQQHPLPTPAIVLIGAAAACSEQLAWFDPERDAAGFAGFLSLEGDD
uniref:uroporphyrinogen-III C-methyltransferase n=1 Tax=Caldilinea aerophila TaxID=133453 RepID=A0A7C1JFK3_9CHLR